MSVMPGKIRDILFGSSILRLNWTLESMMSVAQPAMMIHGVAILLPRLDLAAGKFAPETVGFNDEAASVLI